MTLSVNADLPEKASPKFGQAPKATEGLYYLTSRKCRKAPEGMSHMQVENEKKGTSAGFGTWHI